MSLLLLADVKPHLKITDTVDDVVLQAKLDAAEAWVSRQIGGTGALAEAVVTETVYGHGSIAVTKVPILSAASVTSVVGEKMGALTLTDLAIDVDAGVIRPKANTWYMVDDYYTVTYATGYAAAADVPEDVAEAVRLMTKHFYGTSRGPTARPGTGGDQGSAPDAYARAQQILDDLRPPGFA
jgi:uncharacterized phiE125 gp8 family phage protein